MTNDRATAGDRAASAYDAPAPPAAPDWAALFANTTSAVAVIDARTDRVAFTTPAFAALHGYAAGELTGLHASALHPEGARDAVAAAVRRAAAERVCVGELPHARRDGTTFPARDHLSLSLDGDHRVVTVEDLAAALAGEQALRENERLLHEAQRVARIGSWRWEVATNELRWSDTICALYGVAPADAPVTFDGYLALVHPDDQAMARAVTERAFVDREPFAFHHRVVHPDGSVRTLFGRGEVVVDADGRVVRMLGSSEDVTERLATEAAERAARAAAERGERRTAQLQRLTAALAAAASARDVGDAVLEQGRAAFGACGGTVVRVAESGDVIEIVAHMGYDVAVADRYRLYPLGAPSPTTDAIRGGRPVVVHGAEALAARYPFLAEVFASMGARGLVAVPLRVEARTFGGLALFLATPESFGDDEAGMLNAFAGQCAQALERVHHLAAEQAGRAAERLLAAAGQALAESFDDAATLQSVAELAVPAVADWAVFYRAEGGGAVRRIAWAGPPDARARFAELEARHPVRVDAPGAIARAIRDGVDVHVPDVSDAFLTAAAMDEAHGELLKSLGYRSAVIVPMRAHGEVFGALLFGTAGGRRLGARELDLARRLADRAALAIEQSRLYANERRARAEAEAARRRSAFLAEASRLLGDSLDYAETLRRVARSFVPELADWCTVDLIGEHGMVDMVAVAHVDPSREAWARGLRDRFPVRFTDPTGLGHVLREGAPLLLPDVTDELLVSVAQSMEELAVLRELRLGSYLCVPLRVRDAVIGAITFVHEAGSGRRYDAADLALAEELARRAATAIDHARAFRAAQVANQVKSEFLAVMSHELRTPLNAIGGYVELLELGLRGPVTDAQRRDLARIRVSQQHLLGLISAVLDLSRVESGRVTYALEPVAVDAFLQSLDALIAPQAAAKRLTLECRPCAASLGVRADREKLRQVLLNLLSNAVRYTPAGGRITLAAEPRGGAIAITVADTGIGIPPDALERVFEAFVQLDRSITPAREGVGLGLAISRDLARGMGGDLVAASEPGAGSVFTLTLPAADAPGAWLETGQFPARAEAGA